MPTSFDRTMNATLGRRELLRLGAAGAAGLAIGGGSAVANAGTRRVVRQPTGKAKNVMALSQRLIDDHPQLAPGDVPQDRDYLESLPGVGRKTANVVMNMAFGHHTNAVDTHVFRVSNRTGLAPGKTVEAVEAILDRVVPEPYGLHAHHWLILHGRYLCKARRPECWRCPVIDICKFKDKTPNPADAPPRAAPKAKKRA